jgi:RNA polymerase sigma-70 factor (ECF subfamily)
VERWEEEPQLVLLAQAGDRQAFAALVEHYWRRVFRWLYGLTHNTHLAEDLTQEAFLKAWRALGSFQSGASFRAWLFHIARNCLIDGQRGPRSVATRALDQTVPAREPGPVEVALDREGQILLQEACARLPEHFRAAFFLWAHEDLSFAEIAQAVGTTEATARWRVFKARLFLLNELGSYLDKKLP